MSITVEDVLAHHGVKGMKWGQRREQQKERGLDSTAAGFKKSAARLRGKAEQAGAYAYLRTDTKGKVSESASLSKKLAVSNAQARAEKLREKARKQENVAKGIENAKKLVKGMDMKQSIKTLRKGAGLSEGSRFADLFMSQKDQLNWAAIDYALKTTKGGAR